MSKKSKKRAAEKEAARRERVEQFRAASARASARKTEGKRNGNRIKIIIISAVSLLLVAAFVIGLVAVIKMQTSFGYMTSDLSDYIKISKKNYKNYTLEIDFDEINDASVDRKILSLLYENRNSTPENSGAEMKNVAVTAGDKVYIYYRGYTVDENGNETFINSSSNLLGEVAALDIGSLAYVQGFEEGIIGAVPKNHQFELLDKGVVLEDDVIYVSYSALYPDGTSVNKTNERIDLSLDNVDEIYGEGFEGYFEGKSAPEGKDVAKRKIGGSAEALTFKYGSGSVAYVDLKINYATRCEDNALVVDVHFPSDYNDPTLRGVDAKFDVFIQSVVVYDTPEYNEEFITKTLGVSAETLAKHEGADTVEKHRAYLRSELELEYEKTRKTLIEEAMWDYYHKITTVKKLPETEVSDVYLEYYNDLYTTYTTYYSGAYSSFESFVAAYYGLSSSSVAISYLQSLAQSIVKEKLIFYYIMREEGLVPTGDTYTGMYNSKVQEYLDYYIDDIYSDELSKIESEEEKEARKLEIKNEMMEYYGEEYFAELVYYEYALEKIIDFANVVEK